MDDKDPKTRSEKKAKAKAKDSPYSAKHVRIAQALQESKASKSQASKPKTPSLG
jgi:hypothetical protein